MDRCISIKVGFGKHLSAEVANFNKTEYEFCCQKSKQLWAISGYVYTPLLYNIIFYIPNKTKIYVIKMFHFLTNSFL